MQSPYENVRITSTAELKNLLSTTSVKSLYIEGAAIDYALITAVIGHNSKILESLTLDGRGVTAHPLIESADQLIAAIQKCSQLQSLAIENFGNNHRLDRIIAALHSRNLTKLSQFSLHGTHLSLLDLTLIPDLKYKKLKVLNLTGTFYLGHWESLSNELEGNSSIEELILGNTPIHLGIIRCISKLVSHPNSGIKVLVWNPPKFEANSKTTNSNISDDLKLRAQNHETARQQLAVLQNLIDERKNHQLKMELVFDITNENYFDLNLISGQISLHSLVLQNLTIRINIQKTCPRLTYTEIDSFVSSLKKCQRLRSLHIENFQGTFDKYYWHQLIAAIASQPLLQTLSFRKTYIGPAGMALIIDVLRNNQLIKLDLTLSGIIRYDDAEYLAEGINSNTSLKEITLDKTPLTLEWLQLLQNAVAKCKAKPILTWKPSPKEEMQTKMRLICSELVDAGYSSKTNDAIYYLGIFCEQIEKQNEEVQLSTYARLSSVIPSNSSIPVAQNPDAITQNTGLLITSKVNYGACVDSKTSGFKPR